jgi:cob(I)alamin adenosyltransferase
MKIYTKKGDTGETSILGPHRYSKADLRICAIGDIDELNAHLGLIQAQVHPFKDSLTKIQSDLFVIGAQLAVESPGKYKIPEISTQDVESLESWIDQMETELPKMTHFILPTGDTTCGYLHISRAVCRRAERTVVALHAHIPQSEQILKYLNRLSDLLFVWSRYHCLKNGIEETKWIPKV